ncbi:MAG: PRC-barrel domain-containing protein, partial [Thermodesulfobacteriota bacterium]
MGPDLKEFYFFSDFLNRRVYSLSMEKVGKITDLVAEKAEPYPMIVGMMVRTGRRKMYLPWEKIVQIEPQLTHSEKELIELK